MVCWHYQQLRFSLPELHEGSPDYNVGGGGEQLEMRMVHALYRKSNLHIPEKDLLGLSPNSYIHVSVSDLLFPGSVHILYLDAAK